MQLWAGLLRFVAVDVCVQIVDVEENVLQMGERRQFTSDTKAMNR
jgi:hypothetical protein